MIIELSAIRKLVHTCYLTNFSSNLDKFGILGRRKRFLQILAILALNNNNEGNLMACETKFEVFLFYFGS